jgi:hypothetical protein
LQLRQRNDVIGIRGIYKLIMALMNIIQSYWAMNHVA